VFRFNIVRRRSCCVLILGSFKCGCVARGRVVCWGSVDCVVVLRRLGGVSWDSVGCSVVLGSRSLSVVLSLVM
jgi:hypothetical protein